MLLKVLGVAPNPPFSFAQLMTTDSTRIRRSKCDGVGELFPWGNDSIHAAETRGGRLVAANKSGFFQALLLSGVALMSVGAAKLCPQTLHGLSQIMPAFGDLLTDEHINDVMAY